MVIRARLAAPREEQQDWPWHKAKTTSLTASLLFNGDRRMEAENYLARGFGTRIAIEAKPDGWTRLVNVAHTWQPSRLKGIQVGPEFGTPFLAATQVYDLRPVSRKWLSLDRTDNVADRFVASETILLTCSGNVGRATLGHSTIDGILISHDLLRIDVNDRDWWGWVYAYLRAPTVREMMLSARYGHIIKHLEISHLDALPIVVPQDPDVLTSCADTARQIVALRNKALQKIEEAESLYAEQFASVPDLDVGENGFVTRASLAIFSNRRRLDAWKHNPLVKKIEETLSAAALNWVSVEDAGFDVWLPNRFVRINAEDGTELLDSSSIFQINPDIKRKINGSGIVDRNFGMVQNGWLMMSRSGQTYGLLGSVAMATTEHEGKIISDDVIRIAAQRDEVHEGFLFVALNHPTLGRPRVKALAYGSSIPHIEVADLAVLKVPRLTEKIEARIGNAACEAAISWAEADRLETELGEYAEAHLSIFVSKKN